MITKKAALDLSPYKNRSVLVIDDNHAIHQDYRIVLRPEPEELKSSKLDELENLLFAEDESEDSSTKRSCRNFVIQSAFQGKEGLALAKKHMSRGVRYPIAFVDMRMPPGMDGLETIEQLRDIDRDMTFAIVTAYSDHSESAIFERLGSHAPVQIIYKPFEPAEVYNIAYEAVAQWNEREDRKSQQY